MVKVPRNKETDLCLKVDHSKRKVDFFEEIKKKLHTQTTSRENRKHTDS